MNYDCLDELYRQEIGRDYERTGRDIEIMEYRYSGMWEENN